MRKHALLSASGAERWLICTPSARLEEEFEEQESIYADEGTFAHALGELLIKEKGWGIDMSKQINKLIESEAGQLYYNEEMQGFCEEYAEFVVNRVREAPPGATLIQEQRLNLAHIIPEGFGTTDNAIVSEPDLEIIDFKYGKGVPVDAYENKQMMIYGLGALNEYDLLYDIKNVRMIIYQPRINNISEYEVTAANLKKWALEVLRPLALKAYQGIGEFIPGEHCRFCRVKSTCKAHAELNLRLAARDFDPPTLTDEQVAKILLHSDRIKKWLTSVEDYALNKAKDGYRWPGMKLVHGRSNRTYSDPDGLVKALEEAGYQGDQLVNKKIIGITKLSKIVTKLHFNEIVEKFLEKPEGKLTLVQEEDKRPEFNRSLEAASDFNTLND